MPEHSVTGRITISVEFDDLYAMVLMAEQGMQKLDPRGATYAKVKRAVDAVTVAMNEAKVIYD